VAEPSRDDDSAFDDQRAGGLAAAAAAAVSGAIVDLVLPGAGAPVGVGVQWLVNFLGRGIERRRDKALDALDEACAAGAVTAEELLDRAGSDERRVELTMRAMDAAARSTSEAKIRALGRALATGVLAEDDAIVDREMFVVDALSRLEAPHIKLLNILSGTSQPQRNGVLYTTHELAWSVPQLVRAYPQVEATLGAIVAALTSLGAAVDVTTGGFGGGEPSYQASDFGHALLRRLRGAGGE
jgi:hypothetical protein